ncbi:MAG: hypothetical protein SGCHY_000105 [Lobulomycetales sp.]
MYPQSNTQKERSSSHSSLAASSLRHSSMNTLGLAVASPLMQSVQSISGHRDSRSSLLKGAMSHSTLSAFAPPSSKSNISSAAARPLAQGNSALQGSTLLKRSLLNRAAGSGSGAGKGHEGSPLKPGISSSISALDRAKAHLSGDRESIKRVLSARQSIANISPVPDTNDDEDGDGDGEDKELKQFLSTLSIHGTSERPRSRRSSGGEVSSSYIKLAQNSPQLETITSMDLMSSKNSNSPLLESKGKNLPATSSSLSLSSLDMNSPKTKGLDGDEDSSLSSIGSDFDAFLAAKEESLQKSESASTASIHTEEESSLAHNMDNSFDHASSKESINSRASSIKDHASSKESINSPESSIKDIHDERESVGDTDSENGQAKDILSAEIGSLQEKPVFVEENKLAELSAVSQNKDSSDIVNDYNAEKSDSPISTPPLEFPDEEPSRSRLSSEAIDSDSSGELDSMRMRQNILTIDDLLQDESVKQPTINSADIQVKLLKKNLTTVDDLYPTAVEADQTEEDWDRESDDDLIENMPTPRASRLAPPHSQQDFASSAQSPEYGPAEYPYMAPPMPHYWPSHPTYYPPPMPYAAWGVNSPHFNQHQYQYPPKLYPPNECCHRHQCVTCGQEIPPQPSSRRPKGKMQSSKKSKRSKKERQEGRKERKEESKERKKEMKERKRKIQRSETGTSVASSVSEFVVDVAEYPAVVEDEEIPMDILKEAGGTSSLIECALQKKVSQDVVVTSQSPSEVINKLLLGQIQLVEQYVEMSRRLAQSEARRYKQYTYTTLKDLKK